MLGARVRKWKCLAAGLAYLAFCGLQPAHADYPSSAKWFDSLSFMQRVVVQAVLVLDGRYDGLIDGAFGPRTYQALLAYQADASSDGVLTTVQADDLFRRGTQLYRQLGFNTALDPASRTTLPIPYGLVERPSGVRWGTRWSSTDGSIEIEALEIPATDLNMPALFDSLSRGPNRTASYSYFPGAWFAVGGTIGAKNFYAAFRDVGGASRGFSLTWSQANPRGAVVAAYLASALIEPQAMLADAYLSQASIGVLPALPSAPQPQGPTAAIPSARLVLTPAPQQPTPVVPPAIGTAPSPSQRTSPGIGAEIQAQQIAANGRSISVITVEGQLQLGDDKRFANEAVKLDEAIVVLSGPGGNLLAGTNIGNAIRLKGFATFVPAGFVCASACALAWLAGVPRLMEEGSKVGFHAATVGTDASQSPSGPANALVGAYLNQLGLPAKAVVYITAALPSDITFLTPEEAAKVGLEVRTLPK